MPAPLPVVVLAGTDPVDLEITATAAACDVGATVGVRLTLVAGAETGCDEARSDAAGGEWREGERGEAVPARLAWAVADVGGVVERGEVPVVGPCANCCVREAITDLLERLQGAARWAGAVVALPAGVEPMPLALRLTRGHSCGRPLSERLDLRQVVTVVDADGLSGRLFDTPAEDETGVESDDERRRREVLLAQIEFADALVLSPDSADASPTDMVLLRHLARPGATVVQRPCVLDGGRLFAATHDIRRALAHADPRTCVPVGAPDGADVASVQVSSWKPFHPERLLARFEQIALCRGRCRGAFWLPGRPDVVMVLDAAGGDIGLGAAGGWERRPRRSHLVVTCPAVWAPQVRACLEDALMTDAEMVGALEEWGRRCDGFEAWAGAPTA